MTSTGQEVIDITLWNGLVKNSRVSKEPSMSDYKIITFGNEFLGNGLKLLCKAPE